MTFGMRSDGQRLVNHLQRGHAHRTAGAVHQLNLGRKNFVNAIAHQRVRLAAADFHQHPRAGDAPRNRGNQRPRQAGVAILVNVLHGRKTGILIAASSDPGQVVSQREGGFKSRIKRFHPACVCGSSLVTSASSAPISWSNSMVRSASSASSRLRAKPT